jgi:hypothetical protein
MPTYSRGQIVLEDQVGVYHCIARCVRRAFLCGVDPYTGQDFSHRKNWILDRMRGLAGLFAIEVCGYSVMSNHLHLVLRNRPDIAEQWSSDEIALRMLLGWTGRELRADKRGAIPDHLAPIVERLGLNRSNWVETVRGFGRLFKQAVGRSSSLVDAAARHSRRWFQGKVAAPNAFV